MVCKVGVANRWVFPSNEAPSVIYTTKNNEDDYDLLVRPLLKQK